MIIVPLAAGILPVILFLSALVVIDSYKLVAPRAVLLSVGAGMAAGLVAWAANVALRPVLHLEFEQYSRYVAPIVEESLKAAFVVWLLWRNRVGFVVDAAIHGFGIGAGFAVLESLYYLQMNYGVWAWIVRGFGTAIMHGGTTAILAMVAKALLDGRTGGRADGQATVYRLPSTVLPGLALAIILHSLYNHFLLQPLLATALIVLVLPSLMIAIFQQSEKETQRWLGTGFDTDQELMRVVHDGQLAGTPVGKYLTTLREHFPAEVIVDMMCLLRVQSELAVRAKGVLMMREAGFEPPPDPAIKDKLGELRYLEKNIGPTGLRALKPFLQTGTRDLWQLSVLDA